jgi:hypothetical protein
MDEVGARLRSLFEEIAPPLDIRAAMAGAPFVRWRTRGWLVAVAAAVIALLAGGGWLLLVRGRPQPGVTSEPAATTTGLDATTTSAGTSTSIADLPLEELHPVGVVCTSELDTFPCSALTDDDPVNAWNAQEGGVGAEVTFYFSPPVQVAEVVFRNLDDPERFTRNARIRSVEVSLDDMPQATIAVLADSREAQRVQVRSVHTSRVTVTITSAYPGEAYEGREPFRELALQGIEFWGQPAPASSSQTTDASTTTLAVGEPLPGEWFESRIPGGGIYAHVSDLRWDGTQFLAAVDDSRGTSVWRSRDGLTWEQMTLLAESEGLRWQSSLDHGERGYVVGGSDGGRAAVWFSPDGVDWAEVVLGWGAVLDVTVTPSGFVAVGSSQWPLFGGPPSGQAMVWASADGRHWEAAGVGSLAVPSWFGNVQVVGDRVVALGFVSLDSSAVANRPIAAASDAAGSWAPLELKGLSAQHIGGTVAVPGGLAALENGLGRSLWLSADGETWAWQPLDGLTWHQGYFVPEGLTAMSGRLVVAGDEEYLRGGQEGDGPDPELWFREPDGTWRPAADAPALDPPVAFVYRAAAGSDRVVMVLDYLDDDLRLFVFVPAE